MEITAPLFGDLEDVPDEFVVHISDEDSTPAISGRLIELSERLGLTPTELRRVSSLGIENLEALRVEIRSALRRGAALAYSGRGDYPEIQAVCEVICEVKSPHDFGVFSAKQLTLYLNNLRRSGTMREFFAWHSESYRGEIAQLDNVFKFLRACEYSLPEYFSAVELFCKKENRPANYAYFIAEMLHWFRAVVLKNLEEEGVPIQISERFLSKDDTAATLGRRLRQAALANDRHLSKLEQLWILDALPR